eukprot:573136-Pyramimonas_sp.AAC.1
MTSSLGALRKKVGSGFGSVLNQDSVLEKYRDCHAEPVDYAGRRVTIGPNRATIDMEKYILEEFRPISLAK